jgi:hypothetical protein
MSTDAPHPHSVDHRLLDHHRLPAACAATTQAIASASAPSPAPAHAAARGLLCGMVGAHMLVRLLLLLLVRPLLLLLLLLPSVVEMLGRTLPASLFARARVC